MKLLLFLLGQKKLYSFNNFLSNVISLSKIDSWFKSFISILSKSSTWIPLSIRRIDVRIFVMIDGGSLQLYSDRNPISQFNHIFSSKALLIG